MRKKVGKTEVKDKTIIMILITLGIIFALLPVINYGLNFNAGNSNKSPEYRNNINLDTENLKLSAVSGPIYINDDNPSSNWSVAKGAGKCTGNGTYSEPYVIEDLVIDGGGSGSCIWIENSDVYFTIENCSLYNSGVNWDDSGISMVNVDNGQLIANIANNSGIRFDNCMNCTISGNNVSYSNNGGIHLSYGSNNTIIGNTANYASISTSDTDKNIISGNLINGGGIFLGNANYTRILNNTVEHSSGDGISFHGNSNNNWISKNFVNNNTWGISFVEQSHNNTAIDNYVNNSSAIGIEVYYDNHTIIDNVITNNGHGIMISSSNNIISGNTVNNNEEAGINLGGNNTVISGNTASYNTNNGIHLSNGNNNSISENNCSNNFYGIRIDTSNNNSVLGNIASDNSNSGIFLDNCTNHIVSGNNCSRNIEIGLYIQASTNNTISENYVIDNGWENAHDDGVDNQWDNGMIGNYWSDYSGKDADDDGIGDTPYTIPGVEVSQDNYPIWWDAPIISIDSPAVNTTFQNAAPQYNISIEGVPDSMWYTIEGIVGNFPITELTGTIDQDTWDSLDDGEITITFYAQDSESEIGSTSIIVIKSIPSEQNIPIELIILISVISGGAVIGVATLLLIKRKRK